MSERDKPRWVETTSQTFVRDEAGGKSGERRFVEPVSRTEVTFAPAKPGNGAIAIIMNLKPPFVSVSVYKWLGFNLEINRLGLPSFKGSRKVAKSVRV